MASKGSSINNSITVAQTAAGALNRAGGSIPKVSTPPKANSNIPAIGNAFAAVASANSTAISYKGVLSSDAGAIAQIGSVLNAEDQALAGKK